MLFSLIALVILLIAAVALMRSFNTTLFTSGNIAFKRDLQNQGERAVAKVLKEFRVGALASPLKRQTDLVASNYSASTLPANPQGIPDALKDDASFAGKGDPGNDITSDNEPTLANQAVSIRYIVDRMCDAAGADKALGASSCVLTDNLPTGGSASNLQGADRAPLGPGLQTAATPGVIYRVSIRVNGPRNTQAFFQSTFTIPSST
ncbi:MAG: hypothetical protein M3Y67_08645 [Pseudomonadota bacterium]|nr:hypothetical protein [Pseudomonadota bacterium]